MKNSLKACCWALGALCLVALLVGCARQAPLECETADWAAVGFVDGSRVTGSGPTRDYAICPGFDRNSWKQGYLAGLANYCTESRIYRQARVGASFPKGCAPLQADLARAYDHGRAYWELDYEIWRLRRRARDDLFLGQRLSRSAEYEALRRERALYASWPPR